MKKLLVVAFLHPYTVVQGGSYRILPLIKYLPEFGWDPLVLTITLKDKPSSLQYIETAYRETLGFWKKIFGFDTTEDINHKITQRFGVNNKNSFLNKLLQIAGEIFYFPDGFKGWQPYAISKGIEVLTQHKFDVILSCHPMTSHLVASKLKAKSGVIWVADFPDLWSQNHNYSYSRLRRKRDTNLEIRTLANANALITVSEPWADKLRKLHKEKQVFTITHGFDPDEVNIPPYPLTDKFTITYTGKIYPQRQDPSKLFEALRKLITNGFLNPSDIEVRFYGAFLDWLENEIATFGLSNVVKQCGQVAKANVLERQRESQLLLSLKWEDEKEKGVHSWKIYEYLAARRPVLAIGGSDDVLAKLIDKTGCGINAFTIKEVENALITYYREYKIQGKIIYHGKESEIDKYSYRQMAKSFAEKFDKLTET